MPIVMIQLEEPSRITLPERARLSKAIKEQALSVGFDKVGIVPAGELSAERERLREWLDRGFQGEMHWMARDPDTRTDPRLLFPSACSVVVVALNYYTPNQHSVDTETGKVSRYAWGDDYHDVVGTKLKALMGWIEKLVPETKSKVCVDIQPMMDKVWARRAGLGWIGKHTNLITTDFGSWVFIGELLLDLELEYDSGHVEDHCGSCTLCIEACPTGALNEPYVLDSTKCISYATIELREAEIPPLVGDNLEGWLYGCDICQDVCPWNRFESPTMETRFQPRLGNVNAELSEILNLTPQVYSERFRGSAMKRAKLPGLQRNARTLSSTRDRQAAVNSQLSHKSLE